MRSKENIWTVPNILTMLRLALIGVLVWQYARGRPMWALAVFLLAGVTDFLDGFIARKWNLITDFGKLMDPLADKLMLIAALACLMVDHRAPMWILAVVVVKEFAMVVGGYWLLRRGIVVQARLIGKAATVSFLLAVAAAFLHDAVAPLDFVLLCGAAALSVGALAWYVADTVRSIEQK
ncbi:MAG: CDP-alcohol phosphatidyltransferase family protein [Firmicutes bacterium]|nr:CDP-alcohol phosphatidyltransferase family protein [Bacillota bacterium]